MKGSIRKLVVLTSGGDAPGMNAAIRAVVRSAQYHQIEVLGCRRGYAGLVSGDLIPMGPQSVANCIQRGGTILKTDRCAAFLQRETRDKVRTFLKQQGIEAVVVIGGDGSYRGATLLETEAKDGPKTIGIPGTIDNDIPGTDYTIGFDTARNTALQAIDKIRDTASSHDRNFLVEVMGHRTGFLAYDVGIAGGAELILTPEFDLSAEDVAKAIKGQRREKLSSIIVVAEGDKPGRSMELAERLKKLTQKEYRVCILGHTQRGGTPTAMDRKVASAMGAMAVRELVEGRSNRMMVMKNYDITSADFPDPQSPQRRLTDERLLELNTMLAI